MAFQSDDKILVHRAGKDYQALVGDLPIADHTHPYVKVAGDNMTGNLTFNTDKIVLSASDGSATFDSQIKVHKNIKIGHGHETSDPQNLVVGDGLSKATNTWNTAVGLGALLNNTSGKNNTAIGVKALEDNVTGEYNLAVGNCALQHTTAGRLNTALGRFTLNQLSTGSANVAVGNGAGQDTTTGGSNTIMGNSAGQGLTEGNHNIAIGAQALYGIVQINATNLEAGKTYTIHQPGTTNWVAIGAEDNERGTKFVATGPGTGDGTAYLSGNTASYNIGVGSSSLRNIQSGENNIAIGYSSLYYLQTGSENTAVGKNALNKYTGSKCTAVGYRALENNTGGTANTAYGVQALVYTTTGGYNTAFGDGALFRNSTGKENTGAGSSALHETTTGNFNAALGRKAMWNNKTGSNNAAVGHLAGNIRTDGADNTNYSNCTYLGANSRASGSNQVQLGDSNTTTYAYGAVQNRSDARDKTDVRDTVLGLNFINSLRPVDYRWDIREDYQDLKEVTLKDGTVKTQAVAVPQDGSRSRDRFHHGLIAQEVKAAANSQGVDFGGYQDHSVDGGADVLSIGYTELIAPLIKAVQELSAENAELKERLCKAGL